MIAVRAIVSPYVEVDLSAILATYPPSALVDPRVIS